MMMRLFTFKLLLLISWQFIADKSDYKDFLRYASSNFHLEKLTVQDFNENYAIIKLTTNNQNVVTGYTVVNNVPKEFNNTFKYLIGYKFAAKLPIHKRPVYFCMSINNQGSEVLTQSASEKEIRIAEAFKKLHQRSPTGIYLDSPITITIDQQAEQASDFTYSMNE